ncbi:Cys-tRNA(Pro) deacylase [uncultured Ilyobacter sp.]|jgi:Cys-tRNA(Pro)/Cys-tRNA(Cys) deacylase|uniref:Cys-tRNA(Pro) deacylase n=1 Tax=uncultured Ilyobacter sp. TaxID=544433 RepID=UPI0029C069E5|nr:Cys-tRNA(Pro) deacylase [uncultured Ilyobacter sp.]
MKKTNAMRLLDAKKYKYKTAEYPVDENDLSAVSVAAKTGEDIRRIFKTLVLIGDKTGYLVACIPGERELDLKTLAKASKNKKVEMIPMRDLEKITGYIRGGCSPLGMKKSYPTYIDESAMEFSSILISGGRRGIQIELEPEKLAEVLNAGVTSISFV